MPSDASSGVGIWDALCRLWEAIAAKFRARPEYNDVYLYEQAYLEDSDHLQRMADKFALRGRRLKRVALITLATSFLVIIVGILVFLMPTRFADTEATQKEIEDAYDVKRRLAIVAAQAEINYLRARDLYNLYGLFHEIGSSFSAYKPASDFSNNTFYKLRLRYGLDASGQLAARSPIDKRYNYQPFQYHGDEAGIVNIPADIFVQATKELRTKAINLDQLQETFAKLKTAVGTTDEAVAVKAVVGELAPFTAFYESAKERKDGLYISLDEEARNRLQTVEQLQEAERKISDALLEANQPKSGWVQSQPWATLMAVRIGIVVLLLYLTTILLSTYRYTLTLSAYYMARADTLQMLSSQPDDRLMDIDELKTLVPLFSPDKYQIDRDAAPYESLARMMRPGP